MKIIQTKEKTEIKISIEELKKIWEYTDKPIDKIIDKAKDFIYGKKNYHKEVFPNKVFPNYELEHFLKTQDEIRKEEREKVVKEVLGILYHHLSYQMKINTTLSKVEKEIKKLTRKE